MVTRVHHVLKGSVAGKMVTLLASYGALLLSKVASDPHGRRMHRCTVHVLLLGRAPCWFVLDANIAGRHVTHDASAITRQTDWRYTHHAGA